MLLAPDLSEAILEGKHPPDLSLEKCVSEIPLEWHLRRPALSTNPEISA
jgi:hypothetical protein